MCISEGSVKEEEWWRVLRNRALLLKSDLTQLWEELGGNGLTRGAGDSGAGPLPALLKHWCRGASWPHRGLGGQGHAGNGGNHSGGVCGKLLLLHRALDRVTLDEQGQPLGRRPECRVGKCEGKLAVASISILSLTKCALASLSSSGHYKLRTMLGRRFWERWFQWATLAQYKASIPSEENAKLRTRGREVQSPGKNGDQRCDHWAVVSAGCLLRHISFGPFCWACMGFKKVTKAGIVKPEHNANSQKPKVTTFYYSYACVYVHVTSL